MSAQGRRPRVAICIAGAFRSWNESWVSIQRNLVEPTGADVFVVFSNEAAEHEPASPRRNYTSSGFRPRSPGADAVDIALVREQLGGAARAVAVWDDSVLKPSAIAEWAGWEASNASQGTVAYAWRYYLKLWAAQSLAAHAPGRYDVVVLMRPDLFFFRPWQFSFDAPGSFALSIDGEGLVRFGEKEVVTHDFTFGCHNDWIAVGTLNTSTTVAQLIHHIHSARAFAPCSTLVNSLHQCCEPLMGGFLWRAGIVRRRVDLHMDMTRALQEHEHLTKHFAVKGVTKLGLSDTHRMWTLHRAGEYEMAHRRSPLHSGVHGLRGVTSRLPLNASMGHWQWWCADPAFDDFGDMYVAHPWAADSNAHATRAASACKRKLGARHSCSLLIREAGATFPLSMMPLEASFCHDGEPFPICPPQTDLLQAMIPCQRHNLSHRIGTVIGFGERFPWWRSCGREEPVSRHPGESLSVADPSTRCKALPKVAFF